MVDNLFYCFTFPPTQHTVSFETIPPIGIGMYLCELRLGRFSLFTGVTELVPSTSSVCFHPHCGSLIKLSNNNRTAERQRPTEEFKNAVTLTNVPLNDDKLFEVSLFLHGFSTTRLNK